MKNVVVAKATTTFSFTNNHYLANSCNSLGRNNVQRTTICTQILHTYAFFDDIKN